VALTVPAAPVSGSGSSVTQTIVLANSVTASTSITVVGILAASNSAAYSSITDSVSSGQYGHLAHVNDSTNANTLDIYWLQANASGTPTITVVSTGFQFYTAFGWIVNGFAGTPTADSATYGSNGTAYAATVAATTLAISSLPVTSNNNEILLGIGNGGGGFISSFPGWTAAAGLSAYTIVNTAGTDKSGTITFGASAVSDFLISGIYDGAAAPPSIPLLGQILM
jgi:hypothetical protein